MKIKLLSVQLWVALMMIGAMAYGQNISLSGSVVDQNGNPLPGATLLVEGTNKGTATDFDGNYSIDIQGSNLKSNGGAYTFLVASYIGFVSNRIEIGNQNIIDFTLQESAQALEEVLVTAQGISKAKRSLGYAITQLKAEEVEQRAEADLSRTLQGKIAGVQIDASSGQTGGNVSIRIRSSLSITQANSPLIIVNNVPFYGSLQDIDANDIQDISILKGLNASILYGSEGRNGVILIHTKSGGAKIGEKKLEVRISQTTYFNEVANLPEYQTKYGQGSDFGFASSVGTWGPAYSDLDEVPHPYSHLSNIFPGFEGVMIPYEPIRNNVKNLFKTGRGNITSINIASSQEKTAFNISAGYTDEEGIIGKNDLKRFNLGIGGSAQLTDRLNISATLNYSTRKTNTLQTEELFDRLLFVPSSIDIANLPFQNPQTGASVYYRSDENPLWVMANTGFKNDIVRIFGTVNVSYDITDKLTLNYRAGLDSDSKDEFDFSNKGGFGDNELGFLDLKHRKRVIVDQSLILGLNNISLSNKIGLDAQIGINSKFLKGKSNSSDSSEQIVFGFLNPKNFSIATAEFEQYTENLVGVFGQLEFSYDRFLYLTLSGRNDWGSTVEQENRNLFYPGASLSFIPTSAFEINSKGLNYLKLRGAYATSSGFPDRFLTRSFLETNPRRFVDTNGTVIISNALSNTFANPNLRPELHREFELGLEGRFFNNRVTLESSVFKRISENQILKADRPPSTGFVETTINVGRIDTKGIEVDLGIDILKGGSFGWNLRNLFTAYETTVIDLPQERILLGDKRFAIEGQPLGVLRSEYAVRDDQGNFLIDPANGFLLISDEIGLEDKIIGDPNPDWALTTINTINYKGFSLSAQMEYTHGGDIISGTVEDLLERGVTRDTENREGSFVLPGVLGNTSTGLPFLDSNGQTIPNTIQTNAPRAAFSNYYNADDLKMFDATTLRLREISLSYTLDKIVLSKLPIKSLTLSLGARNLWYKAFDFPKYMNYDPENDGGKGSQTVPTTKRISLGISATF